MIFRHGTGSCDTQSLQAQVEPGAVKHMLLPALLLVSKQASWCPNVLLHQHLKGNWPPSRAFATPGLSWFFEEFIVIELQHPCRNIRLWQTQHLLSNMETSS